MTLLSRTIDAITRACAHPLASVISTLVILGTILLGAVTGFTSLWYGVLGAATGLLSIALLFILSHSTAKDGLALQIKMDALIFAVREAQNDIAGLETEEMPAIRQARERLRQDNEQGGAP